MSGKSINGSCPSRVQSLDVSSYNQVVSNYLKGGEFWPMFSSYLLTESSLSEAQILAYLIYEVLGFSFGDAGSLLSVSKGTVLRRVTAVKKVIERFNSVL